MSIYLCKEFGELNSCYIDRKLVKNDYNHKLLISYYNSKQKILSHCKKGLLMKIFRTPLIEQ